MVFELLLDIMDRFLNTSAGHQIRPHTRTDQTVPRGRLVWGALSLALRARLRSGCPSGTFAASSYTLHHHMRTAPPALSVSGDFATGSS
jgi:hypothetical protein